MYALYAEMQQFNDCMHSVENKSLMNHATANAAHYTDKYVTKLVSVTLHNADIISLCALYAHILYTCLHYTTAAVHILGRTTRRLSASNNTMGGYTKATY